MSKTTYIYRSSLEKQKTILFFEEKNEAQNYLKKQVEKYFRKKWKELIDIHKGSETFVGISANNRVCYWCIETSC